MSSPRMAPAPKTKTVKFDPNSTTLYLRPVPEGVKDIFKAECAKRRLSMLAAHVEFMRNAAELLPIILKAKEKRERDEKFIRGK